MKFLLFTLYMLFCIVSWSSDSLNFVSPVDHEIKLSGNFMELRTNHFHSGIDIKSKKGVTGDVIRSVQNGHVSRIRITSGSYGNALYIDHPNGLTSVYAHLKEFNPEIQSYLDKVQYAMESFEVDVYLPDSLLSVAQGQQIGKMGNTGRSFGPHLHFELRDTKTERPVNPELYGLTTGDDIPPTLQAMFIYNIDDSGRIIDTAPKYFNKKKKGYHLYNDVIEVKGDQVGFGLQMFDRINATTNKNGVYAYELYVDGALNFSWKADAFSFSDSRNINGFIDFKKNQKLSQKVYLLYKQVCNDFPYYEGDSDGIVRLQEGDSKSIRLVARDIKDNVSSLEFTLIKSGASSNDNVLSKFSCDSSLVYTQGAFHVEMEPESFYTPHSFNISNVKREVLGKICQGISIGDKSIPVNKYYKISCEIPPGYNSKWTFVSTDSKGRFIHFGADTLVGRLYTYVDQLGDFFLYHDTTPPKMEVINLEYSMKSPWKVKIYDNLIPDGRVDDIYFRATVNGNWINMRYDLKNKVLIFNDFDRLPKGLLEFKLFLCDDQGNKKTYVKKIM